MDELPGDPYARPGLSHASFQNEVDSKVFSSLRRLHSLALEGERRVACHDEQSRDLGEVGNNVLGDSANWSNALQARGDIDTVAKDILPLHNHVAHVNAHAEFDPVILWHAGVSFTHITLQFGSAGDRVHDARKFHQHSITCYFDDSALMLADFGI